MLLDENLPRQLKTLFTENLEVTTVPGLGWQSKKNGELLAAMVDAGIGYLITADRNLRFQQNLGAAQVKLIILLTHDIRRKTLEPFVSRIEQEVVNWDGADEFLEIDLREAA